MTTIPEYQSTPIWITEIAIHVGFDGRDWVNKSTGVSCTTNQEINSGNCKIVPIGKYHWDLMSDYLIKVLNWLETKQDAYNISKWFFFHTWQDINNPRSGSGYMGIYFYDDGVSGANLTCLGEVYKAYSLNQSSTPPSVRCDSDGNTVFD